MKVLNVSRTFPYFFSTAYLSKGYKISCTFPRPLSEKKQFSQLWRTWTSLSQLLLMIKLKYLKAFELRWFMSLQARLIVIILCSISVSKKQLSKYVDQCLYFEYWKRRLVCHDRLHVTEFLKKKIRVESIETFTNRKSNPWSLVILTTLSSEILVDIFVPFISRAALDLCHQFSRLMIQFPKRKH